MNKLKDVNLVAIETNGLCNLRCSYCPNSTHPIKDGTKLMDENLFYKIINELKDLNWCGEIQPHFFGEPLLDKRFLRLMTYAKKQLPESKILLFSNGTKLTLDLYKKLIEIPIEHFFITEHVKGIPRNIQKILDWNEKNDTTTKFTYTRYPFKINNRGGLIKLPKTGKDMVTCFWPTHNITINYKGDLIICCNDYLNQIKIGNVNNKKLYDIWNEPSYIKKREDIRNGILRDKVCKLCEDDIFLTKKEWEKFNENSANYSPNLED